MSCLLRQYFFNISFSSLLLRHSFPGIYSWSSSLIIHSSSFLPCHFLLSFLHYNFFFVIPFHSFTAMPPRSFLSRHFIFDIPPHQPSSSVLIRYFCLVIPSPSYLPHNSFFLSPTSALFLLSCFSVVFYAGFFLCTIILYKFHSPRISLVLSPAMAFHGMFLNFSVSAALSQPLLPRHLFSNKLSLLFVNQHFVN